MVKTSIRGKLVNWDATTGIIYYVQVMCATLPNGNIYVDVKFCTFIDDKCNMHVILNSIYRIIKGEERFACTRGASYASIYRGC